MTIADMLIGELEQEAATTRKILERIPTDKLDWRPHEKSMTLGQLGWHIATTPGDVASMVIPDSIESPDFNAPRTSAESTESLLATLDESVAKAKEALTGMDDARMGAEWSVKAGDETIMAVPRAGFLRGIMFNHWYHHRGQLSVYLRLVEESVPSVYGPTADEMPDWAPKAAAEG